MDKTCFCGISAYCGYQVETDMKQHDKVIFEDGYCKAIDDMVGNLIANSRTESIDGKLMFIVTEERIKYIAEEMKRQLKGNTK